MAERVLTTRELNRALLARQLLLRRRTLSVPQAAERIGGIQTQYAPAAYIGLWSRLESFRLDDLTRALERRAVVQATLLRATIHVVSARDFPLFAAAIREPRREWWLRVHRGADPAEGERLARRVRALLAAGPRRRDDLLEALRAEGPVDPVLWTGFGNWLDVVRAPPSGTWARRRADIYAAAEDWLGPPEVSEQEGIDHLVRRYLGAFGPAPHADIADWAGLPVTAVRGALDRIELRRFADERGRTLVDLPRAPLPDADTPAPVRFLAVWDAVLLVHARRTQILPEEYRPRIFSTKTPHSFNTLLVDGAVAGTWRVERADAEATLTLRPFRKVGRDVRAEATEEAERLVRFHEPDAERFVVCWSTP